MRRPAGTIRGGLVGMWLLFILLTPTGGWPASPATLAKEQGNGSRFKMHAQGGTFDFQVGLLKIDSASRAVIEVFAAAQLADPVWQQFILSITGTRPTIDAGYIQVGRRPPMKLPPDRLTGMNGLDVNMFLLSEADLASAGAGGDVAGMKSLGSETIASAAGTVRCSHYRLESADRKLDVWISDNALPIGIVRMVSTGKKPVDNYRLELEELLSGIAPKIDPAKAMPLSDEIRAILTGS